MLLTLGDQPIDVIRGTEMGTVYRHHEAIQVGAWLLLTLAQQNAPLPLLFVVLETEHRTLQHRARR